VTPDQVDDAARRLGAGRLEGAVLGALPESCRPTNEVQAYAIQDRLHQRLTAAGLGEITGHKIGCTTEVMQAFLGIDNPCAGAVFAPTARDREGRFRHGNFRHVGVECEIAARLGRDLTPAEAPFTADSVADAVTAVMAAIEVVDDRYDDYGALGAPTLIADDFFGAGCVLGAPVDDWRALDLPSAAGWMTINGVEVGRGKGGDIMGHPLAALAWLADSFARRGRTLVAGEFVLLGSVVETKWVAAGDAVTIEIDGLGQARASFG